jgi:hypothetical protein
MLLIFNHDLAYQTTLLLSRFADRDLIMRFRGGGLGHKSTREATDFFKKDRDRLDVPKSEDVADVDSDDEAVEGEAGLGVAEDEDSGNDEDAEDDYGYRKCESSESEAEVDETALADPEDGDSDDFGPEDDGGLNPDGELGYGEL